jgi:hypothetical protein
MDPTSHIIDPYLLEKHTEAFVAFVELQSGMPFESFTSNPYTVREEGYKLEVNHRGLEALNLGKWSTTQIGSGKIIDMVIQAVELPRNNLVQWQSRYGDEKRPHQPLYDAQGDNAACEKAESCLYRLYHSKETERAFDELTEVFGRVYPMLAYLFFLKDRSRFLPIAPKTFEKSFAYLGVNFKASGQCSWENYDSFNRIILQIRAMLSEQLLCEVSPLDAHSFVWMLSRQMEKSDALPDVRQYVESGPTEREAVVKARIGQGRFRDALLSQWKGCAVTGLEESDLLRASHVIPWSQSRLEDRTNPYNGLLLAVHLDAAFDQGFVSFDDQGRIIMSPGFSHEDAETLGIHNQMALREIDQRHRPYLEYHRAHVLRKAKE